MTWKSHPPMEDHTDRKRNKKSLRRTKQGLLFGKCGRNEKLKKERINLDEKGTGTHTRKAWGRVDTLISKNHLVKFKRGESELIKSDLHAEKSMSRGELMPSENTHGENVWGMKSTSRND